jgi:topoisomerase-4 subunit A
MPRGKSVRLQRYRDGGLADAKIFKKKEGLTWIDAAGRTWTVTELAGLVGNAGPGRAVAAEGLPQVKQFRSEILKSEIRLSTGTFRLLISNF